MQAKLLNVIEEKSFYKIGTTAKTVVNVRFVCATNKDLFSLTQSNQFRKDLYFRLNPMEIYVPPLRERKKDILLLADYFLKRHSVRMHKEITSFTSEARAILTKYHWPGNVRELRNVVEHAVINAKGRRIFAQDLGPRILTSKKQRKSPDKAQIMKALKDSRGDVEKARKLLGISKRHLYRLIKSNHINLNLISR